jgi:hypothetical protein
MGKFLAVVGGFLGLLAMFILLSLLFIKIGWSLFMVPVFGLAELTWLQALGFALLANTFRSSSVKKE